MHVWSRPKPLPATLTGATLIAAALLGYAGMHGSIIVVAGLLALAVVALTLANWTMGVPLLLLIGAIDGFLKHYSASPVTFILKDALLALVTLGLLIQLALDRTRHEPDVRWRGAIVWACYVGFMLTQILHPAFSFAGAIGAFRAHAMFAILFVIGAIYFRKRERLGKIANLVIVICVICALGALAQHVMGARWLALSPGFAKASLHYTTFPSAAARAAGAAVTTPCSACTVRSSIRHRSGSPAHTASSSRSPESRGCADFRGCSRSPRSHFAVPRCCSRKHGPRWADCCSAWRCSPSSCLCAARRAAMRSRAS